MDVGLTPKSTPSPTPQATTEKPDTAGGEALRPRQPTEGAEPEARSSDYRVSRIGQLQRMAEEAFAAQDLKLSISYDKEAGRFVYRGLDPDTGEVVREYPPEEVLERMARLRRESTAADAAVTAGISIDKVL